MLRYGERRISWAEMDTRSNEVAAALADEGVEHGSRLAIIDKNGVEFWELLFGAAKLGAVLVSVNWRLSPNEMATICADAEARVVVVGPDFLPAIEKEEAAPADARPIAIGEHPPWAGDAPRGARHDLNDPGGPPAVHDAAPPPLTPGAAR